MNPDEHEPDIDTDPLSSKADTPALEDITFEGGVPEEAKYGEEQTPDTPEDAISKVPQTLEGLPPAKEVPQTLEEKVGRKMKTAWRTIDVSEDSSYLEVNGQVVTKAMEQKAGCFVIIITPTKEHTLFIPGVKLKFCKDGSFQLQ